MSHDNNTIMSGQLNQPEALLQQYSAVVISIVVVVSHNDPGTIADNLKVFCLEVVVVMCMIAVLSDCYHYYFSQL